METLRRHTEGYNFLGNPETGLTVRWGAALEKDPLQAPWPELADISISNRCSKGCSFCYRDSRPDGALMSLEAYAYALDSLTSPVWGPVFQVALGGGEPLEHPDFLAMLDLTRERGIVANFTTNGQLLDETWARTLVGRVGAVALSAASVADIPADKIHLLSRVGLRTNLHFVLSRRSLRDAIEILEGRHEDLLEGLSAVVFLTHKPRGRAGTADCLEYGSPEMEQFLSLSKESRSRAAIGFDACFVPPVLHHGCADPRTVDACECGFFSVYVDERLTVKPCSFAPDDGDAHSLLEWDFATIWNNLYQGYRVRQLDNICLRACAAREHCRGVCPHFPQLGFCHQPKDTPCK